MGSGHWLMAQNRKTWLTWCRIQAHETHDPFAGCPCLSFIYLRFIITLTASQLAHGSVFVTCFLLASSTPLQEPKIDQFIDEIHSIPRKVGPSWPEEKAARQTLLTRPLGYASVLLFQAGYLDKIDVFADKSMMHASIDAHVCGMLVWKLVMAGKIEIYTCICKSLFLDILLMGGVCIYCGLNMCTRLHTWLLQVHII